MASIKKLSNPFKRTSSGVPFKKESKPNQGRENPNRDVYGTNRWKKLSVSIRTREPLCRMCKANGELNAAQVVDHIISINSGGEPWDEDNLQPLCKRCHERKSAIEKHLKSP